MAVTPHPNMLLAQWDCNSYCSPLYLCKRTVYIYSSSTTEALFHKRNQNILFITVENTASIFIVCNRNVGQCPNANVASQCLENLAKFKFLYAELIK
jgi:hypothetical protein